MLQTYAIGRVDVVWLPLFELFQQQLVVDLLHEKDAKEEALNRLVRVVDHHVDGHISATVQRNLLTDVVWTGSVLVFDLLAKSDG